MPYLNQEELSKLGFKSLGENVQISSLASIYCAELMSIGSNVRIDDFCVLSGNIGIGDYVHIAAQVIMTATETVISVGDYSTLSYGVKIFSASDDFSGEALFNPTVGKELRSVTHAPVIVNRFVAVGAGSVIFPGVSIGEGTSIGALSLVKSDTEEWFVYVGSPARKVKPRKRDVIAKARSLH